MTLAYQYVPLRFWLDMMMKLLNSGTSILDSRVLVHH